MRAHTDTHAQKRGEKKKRQPTLQPRCKEKAGAAAARSPQRTSRAARGRADGPTDSRRVHLSAGRGPGRSGHAARAEQPCPPPGPRARAHTLRPPLPGPGGSLHLSLPGYSSRRCRTNFGKSFFGETLALRCPALRFPTSGTFPENVAKKLSQRAEENAFSRRVKTNHRLPCSFSSWRLESPGRPHTARSLGWFATQPSGRGCSLGLGIRPGSGLGPWSRAQALPNPPTTEPGLGAAAPGGHAGEPWRRLQRPESLIAADPSRAHLPPQPPPPTLAAGAARSVHASGAPRGRARSRHESLLGALPVSLLLPASGQRRGELRRRLGLLRFIHYPHPCLPIAPSLRCSELWTRGLGGGREVTSEGCKARSGSARL